MMDVFERLQRDNVVCTSEFKNYLSGFEKLDYFYTTEEHFKNHQVIMHNFGYVTISMIVDPKVDNQSKFPMVYAQYRKSI